MKPSKTKSESVFETFLSQHQISFEPIPASESRRPGYLVTCGSAKIVFEVKELSVDENFSMEPLTVSSRIVGDHIRSKITRTRRSVRWDDYWTGRGDVEVALFENAFAERPISFDQLSPCWNVIRVQAA